MRGSNSKVDCVRTELASLKVALSQRAWRADAPPL
jgi:hypothetical protein